MDEFSLKVIARIHTDFQEKFGIPRQSGLVDELRSVIVFEPEYRSAEALRGLDGFSHLWLIWEFSKALRESWSPTVRPPRLGGNERLGVFATRSPYRPNPIGLSCVRLIGIRQQAPYGTVIDVAGADLMDGTPIFDIKPYLPYADCHPEASGGFASDSPSRRLTVSDPKKLLSTFQKEKIEALIKVLELDPRPSYQNDPDRTYGMRFSGKNVRFQVLDNTLIITDIE